MKSPIDKATPKQRIGLLFRSIISIAILFYLSRKIEWPDFVQLLYGVDFFYLLIAFLILGLAFFSATVRWYFLLHIQQVKLELPVVTKLTFIGAFFNTFLLGSTGGDMVRLFYVFKAYPGRKTQASMSIIMDRILGLGILLLLAIVFIGCKLPYFMQQPQTRALITGITMLFVLLFVAVLFMLKMPFEKLPGSIRTLWRKVPRNDVFLALLTGFRGHQYAMGSLLWAAGFSVAVQLFVFVSAFSLTKAINLDVSFIDLAIIITIVTCIVSLPVSIGGHGLREGAFLTMFSLFATAYPNGQAVDTESIILFSLLYFMLSLGWSMIGGIVYLTCDPLKAIGKANH